MSNVLNQLSMLTRGAGVKRHHTLRVLDPENVGEHSHSVATLLFIIMGSYASSQLLVAALAHDLAECEYGDVPSPTKRSFRDAGRLDIDILEETLLVENGLSQTLSPTEDRMLKLCDILSGLIFCAKEKSLGNTTLDSVVANYSAYYEELVVPVGFADRAWEVYQYALEVYHGSKR